MSYWLLIANLAYVADITDEEERSSAYGLVSATFAASLVTSPAVGNYMEKAYGRDVVVALSSYMGSTLFLKIYQKYLSLENISQIEKIDHLQEKINRYFRIK